MLREDILMGKEYMARHASGSPAPRDTLRIRVTDTSVVAGLVLCQVLDKLTGKPIRAEEWIEPWRFMGEWVED